MILSSHLYTLLYTLPYLRPQLFLGLKVPGDELLLVSGDDERLEKTRGLVGVVEQEHLIMT